MEQNDRLAHGRVTGGEPTSVLSYYRGHRLSDSVSAGVFMSINACYRRKFGMLDALLSITPTSMRIIRLSQDNAALYTSQTMQVDT